MMQKFPDGSGCFVATIGPRERGLINYLKYEKIGRARRWLFVWRMFWSCREFAPEVGVWRAFTYALSCP